MQVKIYGIIFILLSIIIIGAILTGVGPLFKGISVFLISFITLFLLFYIMSLIFSGPGAGDVACWMIIFVGILLFFGTIGFVIISYLRNLFSLLS